MHNEYVNAVMGYFHINKEKAEAYCEMMTEPMLIDIVDYMKHQAKLSFYED